MSNTLMSAKEMEIELSKLNSNENASRIQKLISNIFSGGGRTQFTGLTADDIYNLSSLGYKIQEMTTVNMVEKVLEEKKTLSILGLYDYNYTSTNLVLVDEPITVYTVTI